MKKLIALCLAAVLLLSGCASRASAPSQTSPEAPAENPPEPTAAESTQPIASKEEGDFGLSYLPEYGFNPYTCTATVNRAIFSLLYESLFVVSNQFRAEPLLCESFRVSEDGMTYSFTLFSGVTFSDGTLLTAEDVRASIEAARKSPLYSARLTHIVDMAAEDRTFIVRLDTPYENFALMLDVPVVKAATVEAQRPTGSGPYALQGTNLVRRGDWYPTQTPVVEAERIPLSEAKTTNELRDAFEFGGTDLIYCDPNSVASGGYRCDYEAWEVPTTVLHYLGFNLGSGYFANAALRTAMTYAIDREEISNEIYHGFAQPSVLPCSPASDLYDDQLSEEYDYAPGKFAEAVVASGVTTSSNYVGHTGLFLVCSDDPTRVEAAERIAGVLNEAGLQIQVSALEYSAYHEALENGEFDLYYGEVRLTANFDLTEFFTRYGDLQYGGIQDTGLATLCADAMKNSGSYYELCGQLLKNAPICPVLFKSYAIFVTRGMLSSVTPAVDYVFHNAATARTLSDADQTYADKTPEESGETADAPGPVPEESGETADVSGTAPEDTGNVAESVPAG